MKTGKATQTYIGATVRDAEEGGAEIVEVMDNSPAKKAGLKSGDVVTKFGDRPIEDADELVAAVRTRAAGEKVTLTLDNDRTVDITLGAQPVPN
jgi:putative serine protease PepD